MAGAPCGDEGGVELLRACQQDLATAWRALWCEAHLSLKPVLADRAAVGAAKRYTEAMLTPELLAGPIWRRSYEKPLGYPGDYQIMNYIYDGEALGETGFARLIHLLGIDVGAFVHQRMELMRDFLMETVSECSPGPGPIEITSLGCGPAREVVECLALRRRPTPLRFTLVDHERAALADAIERCAASRAGYGAPLEIEPIHASVFELTREPRLGRDRLPPQNLIYSVGLFDYFRRERCERLAAAMYERLAPGGRLIIGNMRAGTDMVWPLEFIEDWTLHYRTEAELAALAVPLGAASVEVRRDRTGYNLFLIARKPS